MPNPLAAELAPGSLPQGIPPEDYKAYLDAQRQSALAQALVGESLSPIEAPQTAPVRGIYVQPRVGALQGVAKIAAALLGKQASDKAIQSQAGLMQMLNSSYAPGGQMTSEGQPAEQAAPPSIARPGYQPAPAQGPSYSPTNPRNPQGLPADAVRNLAMTDPKAYAEYLRGPEGVQIGQLAGIPRQAAAAGLYNKSVTDTARPGNLITNFATGERSVAPDPARGETYGFDSVGNLAAQPITNSAQIEAERKALSTAATEQNTPHVVDDPFRPGQPRVIYPPTAPAMRDQPGARQSPALPAGNSTAGNSAADLQAQKTGGETGQHYSAELAKNATGATEVRRSLAELKNLASQAKPGAANEAKMRLGSYMIAAGASPETAAKFLGVDIGALQAAQKQTAGLAVSTIHSMTNRGTNFDLETFMRNNPNLNMADPAAFNRVVEYMDKKSQQEIAKQKDFTQFKKGVSPDDWESAHTAHWLEKQNAEIDKGMTNSRPPLSSFLRP